MPTYSPGQIADKTGFSLDTLRYYERIGLLDDIAWLGILRCLRDTGMPIAQMRRYAELTRDERTIRERVDLLEEHDREIGRRLEELATQREHIRGKIRYYRSLDTPGEEE